MSQLVFSMCCDPKELGSNASEEMDLAVRERAKRQRTNASIFHVLYVGCLHKVWPRFKVDLPTSKDPV